MKAVIEQNISVAGLTFSGRTEREQTGTVAHDLSGDNALAAAKSGTLSTRTDDNTGILTLGAGHGISAGDVVDVYWTGGMRYGMDVTADDATTITVDLGAGDVLPAQDSAVIACKVTTINSDWDGDDLSMIAVHSTKRASIDFLDSGGASIDQQELTANEPWIWVKDQGIANPLTGNAVDDIRVSTAETSATTAIKIGGLLDTVP